MYAMTLRRKIKGLAVNENDFMPFLFGAGLLAIEVRRYDFGEEGKLWLWIIIISLLLALPMLLAERRVPSGKAGEQQILDARHHDCVPDCPQLLQLGLRDQRCFDTSEGTATTGIITRKADGKGDEAPDELLSGSVEAFDERNKYVFRQQE